LQVWSQDNPNSQDDESLRLQAFAKRDAARQANLQSQQLVTKLELEKPVNTPSKEPSIAPAQAAQTPAPLKPGSVFKDCEICPEMVVIPAGRFVMGAPPGEEEREKLPENFRNRSQPQHDVKISSFMAGRYEITVGQYRAFAMATNRSSNGGCFVWNGTEWKNDTSKDWRSTGFPQNDSHPVACVSFDDAMAYVQWLQQKTGQSYRLLTEAEWEYAARAETRTARYWGDDANVSCAYANVLDLKAKTTIPGASNWATATFNCDDGFAYTAPVGSFKANGLGLYDMLGNVWEWTQDCWNDNYAGAPTDGSAWTAGDCSRRVARGGSWSINPQYLRAAYRGRYATANRNDFGGFRVARSLQ
jgi:formylglycine-generating enzyme required for sulfatase activity